MELIRNNIEDYIDRFMEGKTTNAEEQAIYRFFRTADVPEHLKEYAPMFAWYEGGMKNDTPDTREEAPASRWKTLVRCIPMAAWSAGIAAVLVIAIGLSALIYTDTEENEWACYEGSYVEVNGKRIDDVKQIMPSILETLAMADHIEQQMEERMADIDRSEKEFEEKEKLVND